MKTKKTHLNWLRIRESIAVFGIRLDAALDESIANADLRNEYSGRFLVNTGRR